VADEATPSTGLTESAGLWFRRADDESALRTLYVPKACQAIRTRLISENHESAIAGHMNPRRTTERLRRHFWWPGLGVQVSEQLLQCRSCAENKHMTRATRGFFSPNDVPWHRWEVVSMDFLSGIPKTARGNDFLLIVVDRLTKRVVLIPCTKEITGEGTARLFVEHVFRHHGMPRAVISDRDPRFTAAFWRQLHKHLGTKLKMSTANHPQTDGQSERAVRSISEILRHYLAEAGDDWDEHLWSVEFSYNDAVNETTGLTPFQADLGRDPATPCTLLARLAQRVATAGKGLPPSIRRDLASAEDFADAMRSRLAQARAALIRAQAAAERSEALLPAGQNFAAGDYVFLRQDALGGEPVAGKLGPRFVGPFKVSERVGLNAYRLMLPKGYGIHPVRNVAELKPANQLRPAVVDPEEEASTSAKVHAATEHTAKEGLRQLRFRLSENARKGRGTVQATTALKRAGFDQLDHFLEQAPSLPNYLGRRVIKQFWTTATDDQESELRDFRGIITEFDPADVDQQYEVRYEDGDSEWLPVSSVEAMMRLSAESLALICAL
jgi:transposase InsO family protein